MKIHILCPNGHPFSVHGSRLGVAVLCPHCYAHFVAPSPSALSWHARAEKGKARPSRDDDDDDDDEPPRKKGKAIPAKKKKDDEEDKPRAKKPAPAKKDENEKSGARKVAGKKVEEDDEDKEEDDEEEEEPIQWNKTKRLLNICEKGLVIIAVACYLIIAFTVLTTLSILMYQLEDLLGNLRDEAWMLFLWIAVPVIYLATITLMGSMFMSLAVPPKAEAKGALIASMVTAVLVLILGVVLLLTYMGTILDDPLRRDRMLQLLVGGSVIFFIVSVLAAMGYMAKLLVFMRMHLEKSRPPTTAGFVLMALVIMLILATLNATLKSALGSWIAYVIAGVSFLAAGFATFMMVSLIKLINSLRRTIVTFIKT